MLRQLLTWMLIVATALPAFADDTPTPAPTPTPSQADQDAAAAQWADLAQKQQIAKQIQDLENARQALKDDTGRFTRAARLDLENKMDQLNFYISANKPQEAADLFRGTFNKFRMAYFTYKVIPARIQELGDQVEKGLIDDFSAAQKFEQLYAMREQAIIDMGTYRSDYINVLGHLQDIERKNQLQTPTAVLEAVMPITAPPATPRTVAGEILHFLLSPKNLNGAFPELNGQLEGLPTIEQTSAPYWAEPNAQIAFLQHQYNEEKKAHQRIGRVSYVMVSLMKAFVDSHWVPEGARLYLFEFLEMAYNQRVRDLQMPLIKIILQSKNTGKDLLEELFNLNAMSKKDELLVTMARIRKSPENGTEGRDIGDLWYQMKSDAMKLSKQREKKGFAQNDYSRMLDRMNEAERWGARLGDLSLYLDGMSPQAKRQTCILALGSTLFTLASIGITEHDKIVQYGHLFLHWIGML